MTQTAISAQRPAGAKPKQVAARKTPSFWERFQSISVWLIGLGIAGTFLYLCTNILPRVGVNLEGSNVVPGWQGFNNAVLYIHILTAIPPLFLGLIGFSAKIRRSGGQTHKIIGTIYCVGIWVSAVTGLLLATANTHGVLAKLGFATLAIAWFTITYVAYLEARRKNFPSHRQWMIRSFAITLAVVSVRPMFIFGPPSGMDYDSYYQIVTWMCWVPNLLIAEWYIRVTNYSGRFVHKPQQTSPDLVAANS